MSTKGRPTDLPVVKPSAVASAAAAASSTVELYNYAFNLNISQSDYDKLCAACNFAKKYEPVVEYLDATWRKHFKDGPYKMDKAEFIRRTEARGYYGRYYDANHTQNYTPTKTRLASLC